MHYNLHNNFISKLNMKIYLDCDFYYYYYVYYKAFLLIELSIVLLCKI